MKDTRLMVSAVETKTFLSDTLSNAPVNRRSLAGLGRKPLGEALSAIGVPEKQVRMRVNQLWSWIYAHGVTSFDQMSDVSKELRRTLEDAYTLDRPEIVSEQVSVDGTRKWLLRLPKLGHENRAPEIETVYIPDSDRGTLCISSQVGCTLTCSFCHTGTQRLVRNLEAQEIAGQIMLARDRIGDWPGAAVPLDNRLLPVGDRKITNVVLMGMGEPLYNFDNVKAAMDIAADGEGLSLSKRRITLSTSGIVPEIPRWGAEAATMLAISLHATNDELRDELVPVNTRWRVTEALDAARRYFDVTGRRVSIEYALIREVNDQASRADLLARLLVERGTGWVHVNPIPLNPTPGSRWTASSATAQRIFVDTLRSYGIPTTVRDTRGREIDGACGQLAATSDDSSGHAQESGGRAT